MTVRRSRCIILWCRRKCDIVDRLIWRDQQNFALCSCLHSQAGAKDVLNNDIQVRKQCFSILSREFSSHGGSGRVCRMIMVSGFQVSQNYRPQMKMKSKVS